MNFVLFRIKVSHDFAFLKVHMLCVTFANIPNYLFNNELLIINHMEIN